MDIKEISKKTKSIFEQYGIAKASLFGSVSRGENTDQSDVDMLVKLSEPMGMFAYMRLISDLEKVLNKKVDLITENSLSRHIRPYITPDLKIIYER